LMLRILREFGRLSGGEKALILRAVVTVALFRIGVSSVPYRWLAGSPTRAARAMGRPAHTPERIAWSVRAAARRVPFATCLTQCLAARRMLQKAGYDAAIHFGWRRAAGEGFEAHAWLEHAGTTLIGGVERPRFLAFHASGGDRKAGG
jgi:hypothetical protein